MKRTKTERILAVFNPMDIEPKEKCSCGKSLPKVKPSETPFQYCSKRCKAFDALVEACKMSLWAEENNEYEAQKQGKPRLTERIQILKEVLKQAEEP